jgi:hypothetical protein
MTYPTRRSLSYPTLLAAFALGALVPTPAAAHCDALDGPVVVDAREALETGELTPVLMWVAPGGEAEVRHAFELALAVRGQGPEARELADRHFFETLVRVHRAMEGEPFTGLKPAGSVTEPAILGADRALATGSGDELVALVLRDAEAGLRERFARALEARRHAGESVEAGREYVAAYVELVHYARRLHQDALTDAAHGGGAHAEAGHGAEHAEP